MKFQRMASSETSLFVLAAKMPHKKFSIVSMIQTRRLSYCSIVIVGPRGKLTH